MDLFCQEKKQAKKVISKLSKTVTPAEAGVRNRPEWLDSGFSLS
jgi:hypothetical protein